MRQWSISFRDDLEHSLGRTITAPTAEDAVYQFLRDLFGDACSSGLFSVRVCEVPEMQTVQMRISDSVHGIRYEVVE